MSQKRKILVTTALIYANGTPHLGHLVGDIQADIWVRFQKMNGHECLHISGSDSHGTPIMIQAQKLGITPEQLISETHAGHVRDLADFLIEFDNYHPTHSEENATLVKEIFQKHVAKNNIDKRTISQLFDPERQMFLPDRFIKGECPKCRAKEQYGDNCEVCGKTYDPTELINPYSTLSGATPIEKNSEHYFFKLQNYAEFLKEWTRGGHLQTQIANKLDEWFKDGLREWDISRDAPYFGFLIPGEDAKYFYVWLDAPIGYLASLQNFCNRNPQYKFENFVNPNSDYELYHFIGKDIIYFHALFWPAILKGADLRLPNAIWVNGFLTVDGQKMSKSRGTYIKARTYLEHLAPEYFRYYLASKLTNRVEDFDINFDDFVQKINSDLVGKFVNIASRCASFIDKKFAGELAGANSEPTLIAEFTSAGTIIAEHYEKLEFSSAIRMIMQLADKANQYIDEKKPWTLSKDPTQSANVQAICTVGINLFKLLALYLKPILPQTAKQVEELLNISPMTWDSKDEILLAHRINTFKPLLTRIDPKQIEALKMAAAPDTNAAEPTTPSVKTETTVTLEEKKYISMDDFAKVDLRIATVLNAEAVEGADKLLKLSVQVGEETKQIFAGIKAAYEPEKIIGRKILIVANLAPRKMRFGISEGMALLAGTTGEDLYLLSPDNGAADGMKVK